MNPSIELQQVGNEFECVLRVSRASLLVMLGALREANEELEDWEFETRMGVSRASVLELTRQLRAELERVEKLHAGTE